MYNDISIGPVTVHMYGIMIAVGMLMGLLLALSRAKARGFQEDRVWGSFYALFIGGFVGGKLLYLLVSLPEILRDPSLFLDLRDGFVVYGAMAGAIGLIVLYLWRKKERVLPWLDLLVPSIALGQGFGRIGCFFAGCCYGRHTDSFFHVTFQNSHYAPNGDPLLPTQLLSSAGDFVICGLLLLYSKREHRDGSVTLAYLSLYAAGRFFLEFLRGDPRGSVGPFSTSQFLSLLTLAAAAILETYLVWGRRRRTAG